jgi:hypothetical protein
MDRVFFLRRVLIGEISDGLENRIGFSLQSSHIRLS